MLLCIIQPQTALHRLNCLQQARVTRETRQYVPALPHSVTSTMGVSPSLSSCVHAEMLSMVTSLPRCKQSAARGGGCRTQPVQWQGFTGSQGRGSQGRCPGHRSRRHRRQGRWQRQRCSRQRRREQQQSSAIWPPQQQLRQWEARAHACKHWSCQHATRHRQRVGHAGL